MKSNARNILKIGVIPLLVIFFGITQGVFANKMQNGLAQKVRNKINTYYDEILHVTSDDNGTIIIKGKVPSFYDKLRIFDIATTVPGVHAIRNMITVDTPTLPNKIIQANIMEEIKLTNSILEPDRINVSVDNGLVILRGEVSYYREKLQAESIASWQKGVKGVENEIKVLTNKQAREDDNIKIVLHEILKNHFPFDKDVTINVNHGEVTLTGNAYRLWDKEHISHEFSNVIGVKKVINHLVVK